MTLTPEAVGKLVRRHLRGFDVESVVRLGEGWENVSWEVNGDLVVRVAKEPDPAVRRDAVEREAAVLALLRGHSPLPVPEVVLVDPDAGALAYPKLPGVPLLVNHVADPSRLAEPLGRFVSALHRIDVDSAAAVVAHDVTPLGAWLAESTKAYTDIAAHVPEVQRTRIEAFLGTPPPAEPTRVTLCHNDLGTEHVLVDIGSATITGVIDWSDAALADPVVDLALVFRDLGPATFEATLVHYDGVALDDAALERARFYARCTLLEDVAYGVRTGETFYAEEGLAHLAHTFG